ncbi:hypothetical protein ACQ9BO_26445 [Flavobacterium sp. P21]|uniref:hypothetical protein n=1 Tax=Flavobacterium sp. P21 TaxID=3423948 RepID=UPI003D67B809
MKKQLLKHLSQIFLLCFISLSSYAQNFHLTINGTNKSENQIIDSLTYKTDHSNVKAIYDEIKLTSEKLSKIGYLENNIQNTIQINDSTYSSEIQLKRQTKSIHIYIGINNPFFILKRQKAIP